MADPQVVLSEVTEQPVHSWCGTSRLHQHLLATVPGYKSARHFVEQFNLVAREAPLRTTVAQIPVVVHVVWNQPEQNISQAQIDSQINVLNDDFNAANSDLSNLPAVFRPLVGNPLIRFFLAKRDPKGKPTTGVTRTQTAIISFDHNSEADPPDQRVKFTAQGGIDGWPSDRYLNLWVCKQGGRQPLLGFAQFPGLSGTTDGVVISHTAFGKGGTAKTPYDLGRTASHEIGHWLNLKHIWGDDDGTSDAGLLCSGTDGCDDTPNQAGPNFKKPAFPHETCGNGPDGDLFMNYMDYSDDDITVMFTKGQVARMNATLSGPRASLAGSNFQTFILHTGTALHNTDETFAFAMTDWNGDGRLDLVAIKKSNTGTNSTEIHILSGASNFQSFILHTGTALHNTDETFDFTMADWNGDGRPDLVAIKKSNTGTNSTEIHILSGASNFQNFIVHTGTALHNTDETFAFAMTDWNGDGRPDLVAIKKSNTGTNSTEIHILSGASNFQTFILHTGTALQNTDETFAFAMTDWNGDGRPDLVAIQKSNTGTNRTETIVLSGASNYQSLLAQSSTALHNTDKTFDFLMADWDGNGRPDLVAIKKSNTGTNSTELHIIAG